ncbi:MAG: biotin-dependent carboxyltransferase family protein [Lachnospiraceae bacterium]|nr:biotin-dependent carboxyltransferase family protein [Lachnospiraceae bacterium]
MGITVKNPGLFTTVQDEGRLGYQQFGVTPSGPMDAHAFHLANVLVGNPKAEGALEMTFQGPSLTFTEDNVIAVTGADMQPKLNGEPLLMYSAVSVRAGDELQFGFAVNGARGYLAFAGGLEIPLVMDSKSTLASKNMGGYQGRKLEAGDTIAFTAPKTKLSKQEDRVLSKPLYPTDEVVLRAVPGPQDFEFTREELRKFFWFSGKITNEFDRMGCRLEREVPVKHIGDGNIISDGIAMGSVQIPTNGQPIIMLADRQTVGGYTKIATVISVDLGKLAQARPGMRVRFVRVGIELAQDLYCKELSEIEALQKRWEE